MTVPKQTKFMELTFFISHTSWIPEWNHEKKNAWYDPAQMCATFQLPANMGKWFGFNFRLHNFM